MKTADLKAGEMDRQITTAADLEALPVGAILVDHQDIADGLAWKADAWQKVDIGVYWRVGDKLDREAPYVARRGPLRLLWTPGSATAEGGGSARAQSEERGGLTWTPA